MKSGRTWWDLVVTVGLEEMAKFTNDPAWVEQEMTFMQTSIDAYEPSWAKVSTQDLTKVSTVISPSTNEDLVLTDTDGYRIQLRSEQVVICDAQCLTNQSIKRPYLD